MGLLSPISYLEKYFHVKKTRAKPKEAGQEQAVQMSLPQNSKSNVRMEKQLVIKTLTRATIEVKIQSVKTVDDSRSKISMQQKC